MGLQFWKKKIPLAVEVATEAAAGSSTVTTTSMFQRDYLQPKIPFSKCYEYYETIPKEQNVVEKIVNSLRARDWSFEGTGKTTAKQYTIPMEAWADKYGLNTMIADYIRDMLITGNWLQGKSDYKKVQLSAIIGQKRDQYGVVEEYAKTRRNNSIPEILKAEDFFFDKYIELDRQPWGYSLFHALINDVYTDVDGEKPLSYAEIFRQLPQDFHKIIHKLGSPRILYAFNNLDDSSLKAEATKLAKMKPGSRGAINQIPEMIPETIDGKGRFQDHIQFIDDNFEAGTGSAANRLITDPSAMADAKSATESNDDILTIGIAAKFTAFMNEQIIPAVLGEEARGKCVFRFGSQEEFQFDSEEMKDWHDRGVIAKEEIRNMLKARNIGKLDDTLWKKEQEQKQAEQQAQMKAGQLGEKKPTE